MASRRASLVKFLAISCAIAVPLLYFAIWIYASGIEPQLSFNKDFGNQSFIARGAVRFFKNHGGRLPHSIEEMVSAGVLPERSRFYRSPIHSYFTDSTAISYVDASYVFDPRGTNTPQFEHYIYRRDDKFPPRFLAENGFYGIDQDIESGIK